MLLSLAAVGCATTSNERQAFPPEVALTIIIADDVGPTLKIAPSSNPNGIAQMLANKRRNERMKIAPKRLQRALPAELLSATIANRLRELRPDVLPFALTSPGDDDEESADGPASSSRGDSSGGSAAGGSGEPTSTPRLYVVVDSIRFRTRGGAEQPLTSSIRGKAQLRERGRVTWEKSIRIEAPLESLRVKGVALRPSNVETLLALSEADLRALLLVLVDRMASSLIHELRCASATHRCR